MEQNNTLTDLIIYYSDMWKVITSFLPHSQCCGLPGTCKTLNSQFLEQAMYVFWESKEDIKFLDECIERSRHYSNPKSWGPIKPVNSSGWGKHDHKKFPIRTAFVERHNMVQCCNYFGPSLISLVLINGPLDYSLESMAYSFPDLKYFCFLRYKGGSGDELSRMLSRAKNLCEVGLILTKPFDTEIFLLPTPTDRHWTNNLKTCTITSNCHINPINQWRPIPAASTTLPSPLFQNNTDMITLTWNVGSIMSTPAVPLETEEIPYLMGNPNFRSPLQQPYKVQLGFRYTLQDDTERFIRINITG